MRVCSGACHLTLYHVNLRMWQRKVSIMDTLIADLFAPNVPAMRVFVKSVANHAFVFLAQCYAGMTEDLTAYIAFRCGSGLPLTRVPAAQVVQAERTITPCDAGGPTRSRPR